MKKFLGIFLFLLSNALFADELFSEGWLRFGWKLDLGFLPQYEMGFYNLENKRLLWMEKKGVIKEVLGLDVKLWEAWRIFTDINIYETQAGIAAYNPFRADFIIGTELRWDMLTLGIQHRCDHPVEGDGLNEIREYHYGGNFTEVYLKINGGYGW